jgi:hypothetical protein
LHFWGVLVVPALFGCKSDSHPSASLAGGSGQAFHDNAAKRALSTTPRGWSGASASALAAILPDAAPPFRATAPIERSRGFIRRVYGAGTRSVDITIAQFEPGPGGFERWVANSAGYPQATLALPASLANGFFTCASDLGAAPCDLHIQLRSGFHVEAMGNGRVGRADLLELLSHLRLGDLAYSTSSSL